MVDFLYLGQLPALLFRAEVWPVAKARLKWGDGVKQHLQMALENILPVRNEIAHVREVSPDRLQRANVACADVMRALNA